MAGLRAIFLAVLVACSIAGWIALQLLNPSAVEYGNELCVMAPIVPVAELALDGYAAVGTAKHADASTYSSGVTLVVPKASDATDMDQRSSDAVEPALPLHSHGRTPYSTGGRNPELSLAAPYAQYKFAWVFSTGHVATTTMSALFRSRAGSSLLSQFEQGVSPRVCAEYRRAAKEGQNMTEWSISKMKTEYLPEVLSALRGARATAFFDPGHHLICGWHWEALCGLLGPNMLLVRARRSRSVTAVSLCQEIGGRGSGKSAFTKEHVPAWWHLSPTPDSLLTTDTDVYNGWSCFQKMLWNQDELEARWQHALQGECSSVNVAESNWNKDFRSYMAAVSEPIVQFFGVTATPLDQLHKSKGHLREDAKEWLGSSMGMVEVDRQMRAYERDMERMNKANEWYNAVRSVTA